MFTCTALPTAAKHSAAVKKVDSILSARLRADSEISQPIYCFNKMLTKMLDVYLQDEKKKASQVHNWTLMKSELFSIIWLDS